MPKGQRMRAKRSPRDTEGVRFLLPSVPVLHIILCNTGTF
ncbi:hypothetical protein COLSTE_01037 [Collinsella stercoris DSM 13279]|uniref:Uncharacterized protein n=1 Tax=Collinsella stercoris DSM 13279 TaxID=445975 RepID=B6GAE0_9ACTN|nr:hypothetical protein COLSTE_01037 [Collinsella stercoris DSM 13279]